jgi:hypothetical protein
MKYLPPTHCNLIIGEGAPSPELGTYTPPAPYRVFRVVRPSSPPALSPPRLERSASGSMSLTAKPSP